MSKIRIMFEEVAGDWCSDIVLVSAVPRIGESANVAPILPDVRAKRGWDVRKVVNVIHDPSRDNIHVIVEPSTRAKIPEKKL